MNTNTKDALCVVFLWLLVVAVALVMAMHPVILKWVAIYVVFVATPTMVFFTSFHIHPKEG